MADFDPFASGQATAIQPAKQESFDPFSSGQADLVQPGSKSSGVKDFFQRLGENLWKSTGDTVGGLIRVSVKDDGRSSIPNTPQQDANIRRLRELTGIDLTKDPARLGAAISSVADTGSRRTDPSRDQGLPALAANIIGQAAPPLALGPLAPAGLGAQIGEVERNRALAEGESEQLADERFRLGFGVGTAAGMIPVLGKRIATKALTGAGGNVIGDIAIETSQGRSIDANQLKTSAGVGALFGAGIGVQQKLATQKPKQPSIVAEVDAATSQPTVKQANLAANEVALKPAEPAAQPPAITPEAPAIAPEAPASTVPDASTIAEMPVNDFVTLYRQEGKSLTDDALALGDKTTEKADIDALLKSRDKLRNDFQEAMKAGDVELASGLAFKSQFFNEAYEQATKTGASAPKSDIGNLLEGENFDKEWKEQGGQGGSENQVIFKDGKVYKRNYNQKLGVALPNYGTLDNFNEHVAIHNQLFPSAKITVEGMSQTSDGPAPVISQIEIKGENAAPREIKAYMAELGFEPSGGDRFVNKELGVEVSDLRDGNVLKDKDGNFHVIDPVIKRVAPALADTQTAVKAKETAPADALTPEYVLEQTDPGRLEYLKEQLAAREITPDEYRQFVNESIPTQQPNAVQVQSPESISIPSQTVASPEVGQQVRRGSQPAVSQEAQAQVASGVPPAPPGPPPQAPAPDPAFNNPLPNRGWTPFLSRTALGKHIKTLVGTIEGNIRKVAPEVFGSLRERGYKLNEIKKGWHDTSKDYGEVARQSLNPDAFTELDRLLQSGLHDQAYAFIKNAKNEPQLRAAIDKFKQTLDAIRTAEINAGREVGDIQNYWIREVADYEGLRRELGKDPSNAADSAIKRAVREKGRALTPEEEADVINRLVSTSFTGQGKPGFLNPRTIGEIQKNWFKYYEPSDVAMENRINRAAKDVVNRAYFGKFDPLGPANPSRGSVGSIEGNFGEIIARMINNGTLSPEGSKVVVRNLQDFFKNESRFDDVSSGLANKIRKAQTYAYLSDISSAIPQFGDFVLTAWRNGVFDTVKGFTNRKLKLSDINIHQGTPETALFSKRNNESFVGKVFRTAVETSIGISDGFNKGGTLNTSFHEAARDMKNPNSVTYQLLDRKWSERFPEKWPEIKRDLQSPAFAKGELNPNTRFFLYSELADLQPISGESTAQGFNRAGPWGKIFYGLRSFAIKQMDVLRESAYEKIRDPSTRIEGVRNLATYALFVAAGQQFIGSYMRDLLLDRESDASEYAVSGLLQMIGLNRYSLYRAKDQGLGTAAIETAVPGVGVVNDLSQSAGIFRDLITSRRNEKTGMKTTPTLADAIQQVEMTKYIPFLGREFYAHYGLGKTKEMNRRQMKLKGQNQPSTIQQIGEMIVPPDKKS